ncbi:hypothetical protein FQA39_LY16195 [Lamprigera yunnana]|nr:hypothetical protein FQA39_LY16195 [Lamprigera yunnana]
MLFIQLIFITASLIYGSDSARILAYIPTPSYSHQVVFQPLWKELSLRGHNVTVLTTNPVGDLSLTNLTEVDMSFSYAKVTRNVLELIDASPLVFVKKYIDMFNELFAEQLEHPSVQKALDDSSVGYDLVIVENLLPAPFAIAEKFKCPFIGISSLAAPEALYRSVGVPSHPIVYPDVLLPFITTDTLLKRIGSVMFSIFTKALEYYVESSEEYLVKKYFGDNYPPLSAITKNLSLLLVNSDPILDTVRPLLPVVVSVRGIHRIPPKPLPKDLKEVLDSATNGFIYFSLGSNMKSKDIPVELLNEIIATFSELPYTILWKFETDFPNMPKNVHISKWLPQGDVLKHPNIKLFITQGGLQSMEEAIFEKVPMIGIPIFADQPVNVVRMVHKGFGLGLDYKTLKKDDLKKTILEVITNPVYKRNITRISDLLQDQPMTGLERAVWWTEYVIRHKGTTHLRSPVLDLPWYQYYLLDVIGITLLVLTLLIYVVVLSWRLFWKVIRVLGFSTSIGKQKTS